MRIPLRQHIHLALACSLSGLLVAAVCARPVEAAEGVNAARTLVDRAVLGVRINPEVSRRDAEAALAELANDADVDLEIRARLLLCDYYAERDRAAAEAQVAMVTQLLPRGGRQGLRAGVLTCQGLIQETAGQNGKARELYGQATQVAAAAKDDQMLAEALFQHGYQMGLQGEYAAGLSDLERARTLFEKSGMPHHAITALNGIAILYNRMGDNAQARNIYSRALKAQRLAGMKREQAVTLYNLGRAHENLGEWDAAREAFAESLAIQREIEYARGEAYALRGLASVANASGDPLGALRTLDSATALLSRAPDARLRAQIDLGRGIALHQLKRLPESLVVLNQALVVFRQGDVLNELTATESEIAAVQAEMGDWRAAYASQVLARATSEKLLRNQLDQRFATLKVEFDTAAKENENALLLRENEANQLALAQGRRVRNLQATVIALTVLLASLLATLAFHQRRSTIRMRELALTDELTGVPNRRAVLGRLEPLLGHRDLPSCAVLIVDLDHFKSVNDHHGHPVGDEVLKLVARDLRAGVREPAFFGRLGGEEFLVVLPETNLEDAIVVADRLREQVMGLDAAKWLSDRRRITASIGVTVSAPTGDSSSNMLKRADEALYAAKRAGRNCVRSEAQSEAAAAAWVLDSQAG